MTTATRAPTFGRRGKGTPQKIRIVAPAPVVGRSGPAGKLSLTPVKATKDPAQSGFTAFLKTWTSAAALASARLNVAAAAAIQHGKSAFADLRTAVAEKYAEAVATKASAPQPIEQADVAIRPADPRPVQTSEGAAPEVISQGLDALVALEGAKFDVPAEIEPTVFDCVAEIIAAEEPVQAEAADLAVVAESGFTSKVLNTDPAPDINLAPSALHPDGVTAADERTSDESFEPLSVAQPSRAELETAIALAPEVFPKEIPDSLATERGPLHQVAEDSVGPEAATAWPAAEAPSVVVPLPPSRQPDHTTPEFISQYELFASEPATGDATSVRHVSSSDDWIWCRAYFLACAVAFPSALGLTCLLGGPTNPLAGLDVILLILLAAVSPALGLVFFLPAVALVHLTRLARIPRGLRDILAGGLLGSIWLLLAIYDGATLPLAAYCCIVGGLLGGCVFWRANRRIAPVAG